MSAENKLVDRLVSDVSRYGEVLGLLATTFNLDPEFMEVDFLPSVLGLGGWDDRSMTSRVAMEKGLAGMDAACVIMQADEYKGRPRTMRLDVLPCFMTGGPKLHAKVVLIVQEKAVRLLVTSANLTKQGYRENREVALSLSSAHHPSQASLIRQALQKMPDVLAGTWNDSAEKVRERALQMLPDGESPDCTFVWSGSDTRLHETFTELWPGGIVQKLTIVSPFWSEDTGPVRHFVDKLGTVKEVRLLTGETDDGTGGYTADLPAAYFDLGTKLNIDAWAQAVNPTVAQGEVVGMRDDFIGRRSLHAKVVIAEGADTTLAYLGSANFTARGWGLAAANVEAGVIIRAGWGALEGLIPPVTGEPVELVTTRQVPIPPKTTDVPEPWPAFLREVQLKPGDGDMLVLVAQVFPDRVKGTWGLRAGEHEIIDRAGDDPTHEVGIDTETLNQILRDHEVMVRWWDSDQEKAFPVSVDMEARMALPVAPGAGRLGEWTLIHYYQGRISWEEMFVPPEEIDGIGSTPVDTGSAVDTSTIQSYQVREFVEALKGIRDDLKAATVSEASMRLALHGPVSPVALARQVRSAVEEETRTPTAGAFQLVEIVSAVHDARHHQVPERLVPVWHDQVDRSVRKILDLLASLRQSHDLGRSFTRYEKQIMKHHGVKP